MSEPKVLYWTTEGMVAPSVRPTDESGFIFHGDYNRLAGELEEHCCACRFENAFAMPSEYTVQCSYHARVEAKHGALAKELEEERERMVEVSGELVTTLIRCTALAERVEELGGEIQLITAPEDATGNVVAGLREKVSELEETLYAYQATGYPLGPYGELKAENKRLREERGTLCPECIEELEAMTGERNRYRRQILCTNEEFAEKCDEVRVLKERMEDMHYQALADGELDGAPTNSR